MDNWKKIDVNTLVNEFFEQDDLNKLAEYTGILLDCPLMVLDDTFHVVAYFCPLGFSDKLFKDAVKCGIITYEVGALISESPMLCAGKADYINLTESPFRRRFAPLNSIGVKLGYLICVDIDGNLQDIPPEIWHTVETVLAKQLFIETGRQDKPFETAEDILMRLIDGGFSSEPYFRLQIINTYLEKFNPKAFALIDFSDYNAEKRHLKEEIHMRFSNAHEFLYKGNIFLFLHGKQDRGVLNELAKEFGLKAVISDSMNSLFELPNLYRTAHEALEMMLESGLNDMNVYSVKQLRTPLMLRNLADRRELADSKLLELAEHDKSKNTQYCETLYYYLVNGHSLKKTCDMLYTHRNTVLYRIRRMQEDFQIPIDDAYSCIGLLLGTALILYNEKGPAFFL